MSVEQIKFARTRPYTLGMRAMEILHSETNKCSNSTISSNTVNLEPVYTPIHELQQSTQIEYRNYILNEPWSISNVVRMYTLIPSEYSLQWFRAERFLKELISASHHFGFEIIGNQDDIKIGFLLHIDDLDLLKISFNGEYATCRLTYSDDNFFHNRKIFFYDFFPSSPYHHLQTQPNELHVSPYETLIRAISTLPSHTQGFVQVLFQPAKHNWQQNVKFLTDIEFLGKSIPDPFAPYRSLQMPSGELRNMARKTETKAHEDKPFFFIALRTGIITSESSFKAFPITAFVDLIYRDSQPFQFITEQNYLDKFDHNKVLDMFYRGSIHRPGFLLNSLELSSLVHLPSMQEFAEEGLPIQQLESLRLSQKHQFLNSGINIGEGYEEEKRIPIYIDDELRSKCLHIIGKPGTGKTTLLEHMILQDIENGRGLAYIDPHGDSVKHLLTLIPESKISSTIYIDFGNPEWIPLWNPLCCVPDQDIGYAADELVNAIKSVVKSNAWGDRLEHILRNSFFGLLHLKSATFFDLITLLEESKKSKNKDRNNLKNKIINSLDNEVARLFWKRDYDNYRRDDFAPPLHKLSKLLTGNETISLMLTQPENRINFNEIINSQKVLLLDLSGLGPDTRGILGCFLLSFLHNIALQRHKIKSNQRKLFSIYCDEAHKLTTDTLEHMLTEGRKFSVNLTLAHQFLNQFKQSQKDALSSVGTTIIFNVDINDARFFVKDLQEKVEPKEIITLKTGEAIARIKTDIIKIETPEPKPSLIKDYKEEIINNSQQQYCRRLIEGNNQIRNKRVSNITKRNNFEQCFVQESFPILSYDEFE